MSLGPYDPLNLKDDKSSVKITNVHNMSTCVLYYLCFVTSTSSKIFVNVACYAAFGSSMVQPL